MSIKAIIVDTAGTTTDFDFIKDVLFRYSAEAIPQFIAQRHTEFTVASLLQDIRRLSEQPDADLDTISRILVDWIEHDNKATPLKALQGLVWQEGYLNGDFKGQIYDDAARALSQWQQQGIRLYSYSSSSADAQQMLFRHSNLGDLSALFYGHFDTNMGQKTSVQAYKNILNAISMWPRQVLFISDSLEELNAAAETGIQTLQVIRQPGQFTGKHPVHHDFSSIQPEW